MALVPTPAPLEASRRVTNGTPLGCPFFLPGHTLNCVQTLKVAEPSIKQMEIVRSASDRSSDDDYDADNGLGSDAWNEAASSRWRARRKHGSGKDIHTELVPSHADGSLVEGGAPQTFITQSRASEFLHISPAVFSIAKGRHGRVQHSVTGQWYAIVSVNHLATAAAAEMELKDELAPAPTPTPVPAPTVTHVPNSNPSNIFNILGGSHTTSTSAPHNSERRDNLEDATCKSPRRHAVKGFGYRSEALEGYAKGRHPRTPIHVEKFDILTGEGIQIYRSLTTASRAHGISYTGGIQYACCSTTGETNAHGMHWRYVVHMLFSSG
jgi:hypothetical protein